MLAETDLAKLSIPVAVDPPADGGGGGHGEDDGEEDGNTRDAVFALKVVLVARARVDGRLLLEVQAALAGGERDTAEAGGLVVLDLVGMFFAPELVVFGLEAADEGALAVVVEFVVKVAVELSALAI